MITLPTETVLSLEQAADYLNVSFAYLLEFLANGAIPHHKAGAQQRVLLADLLRYKADLKAKRLEVLNELTAYDQELGLQ